MCVPQPLRLPLTHPDTPEAKKPNVQMPFKNLTQQGYVQKIVDELESEGITGDRVWLQVRDRACRIR